jgi:N-acetylmuramoyl-L-alanine amidase
LEKALQLNMTNKLIQNSSKKKINLLLKQLSLAFVLLLSSFISPVQARDMSVSNVSYRNHVLSLKHNSFGDIRFKKRIYNDPARLVFDIYDTKLASKKTFRYDDITGDISSVRVAQFEDDTVRIVCEAKNTTALEKIKIENIGQTLYFKFRVRNVVLQDISFQDGDLRIVADGAMVPRTILLDNPERLVLDLIGAELKSRSQEKRINNGDEESIRISQFEGSIVRIVFTGEKTHKREVRISDNEKQVIVLGKEHKDEAKEGFADKLSKLSINSQDEKSTTYAIKGESKLQYKFLKLHNPERLVIDFIDMEMDSSFGSDPLPETPQVSDIRFGKATLGRPVTRVVFDLKGSNIKEEFKESSDSMILYVRFNGIGTKTSNSGIAPIKPSKKATVVIDAGHGGYDHGAMYGGHDEKEINLNVAKKINRYLSQAGVDSYMTRTEDRFISLAERVEISNTIAPKIFVSIHSNAIVSNPKMSGLQTYYYSSSGYKLAGVTHKRMLKDIKMDDGKIRKANFYVCKHTRAPSVLIEMGFMTNKKELKKLASDDYQDELAKSITRGIIEYLEKY